MPNSGILIKVPEVHRALVEQTLPRRKGFRAEEIRTVETYEGEKEYELLTTVDTVEADNNGYKVVLRTDQLRDFPFREGTDFARITESYRIRFFKDGYVLIDCSRRNLKNFVNVFTSKIINEPDLFRMCMIPSSKFDELISNPSTLEVRLSQFTDFSLSNVRTGTLQGLHLEGTREFTDFHGKARLRMLIVRIGTPDGPMTILITQDAGFVIYAKIQTGKEEETLDRIAQNLVIPMIEP